MNRDRNCVPLLTRLGLALVVTLALLGSGQRAGAENGQSNTPASGQDLPVAYRLAEGFVSHLPILLIELPGPEETNTTATLSLFDGPDRKNQPTGTAAAIFAVALQQHGDPAAPGKKSYTMKLAAENGGQAPEPRALAGLPMDSCWQLQGSTQDRGMLRNGLAYTLGRELLPDATPHFSFCEVLFKENGRLRYEGLFILTTSLKGLFHTLSQGDPQSILLGYSRETASGKIADPEEIISAAISGKSLSERGFTTIFPASGDTGGLEQRVISSLDSLEKSLRSIEPGEFLDYASILDENSYANTFLINAFLMNTPADGVPFFLLQRPRGKLTILPSWNFDRAVDNAPVRNKALACERDDIDVPLPSPAEKREPIWISLAAGIDPRSLPIHIVYDSVEGGAFLWLDKLLLSGTFVKTLNDQYHKFRQKALSPQLVTARVNALTDQLGPALGRDWTRWERLYAAAEGPFTLQPFMDNKGIEHIRRNTSYDQELIKLRYFLPKQDAFLLRMLDNAQKLSLNLYDDDLSGNRKPAYALLLTIAFLAGTHLLWIKCRASM